MAQSTTGLGSKTIGDSFSSSDFNALNNTINSNSADADGKLEDNLVVVKSVSDLSSIDSSKVYLIDGVIAMGTTAIQIPSGGATIVGRGFDVSQLTSSSASHTLFTSPGGGSGNLTLRNIGITTSGTGSKVFALTANAGTESIEIRGVNFNNCTSLGYLDGYRQGLEIETGRFGGTPELEFRNAWAGGYRVSDSIARGMSAFTALFKAGTGLTFGGRFVSNMNADLPATGALIDFAPSNITNSESLVFEGAYITRSGTIDASDSTIYPNIDHTNVKSLWGDNVGLPKTAKHLKASVTSASATTVSLVSTYYALAGTFTVDDSIHCDMPSNGEFRNQYGQGFFFIHGDLFIAGTASDEIDIRVTKSTDDGATWPTVIDHSEREILNLTGANDLAIFNIGFIQELAPGDRIRFEVENKTAARDVTAQINSNISMHRV